MVVCISCGFCACNSESRDNTVATNSPNNEKNDNIEDAAEPVSENKNEVSELADEELPQVEPSELIEELTQFEKLFENGPIPAQNESELWGFIDNTGNFVIEPIFLKAKSFRNSGLALVLDAETNLWGMIDTSGNYVIKPRFSKLGGYFSNELLPAAIDDQGWGYINEQGAFVIEPQFSVAYDFSGGFAPVSSQIESAGANDPNCYQLMGYINVSGERITEDVFSEAYDFSEGLACVKQGDVYEGTYGYIDKTGTFAITPSYYDAASFYRGVAFVDM